MKPPETMRMRVRAGLTLVVCALLCGCGPNVPPLRVEDGADSIITLVAGPHQLKGEFLKRYPQGSQWQLRMPREYVKHARRITRDGPEWNDLVYLDFHWPSLDPFSKYEALTEKTPQGPNPSTLPFMTSEKKEYFVSIGLGAGPFGDPRDQPRAYSGYPIICRSQSKDLGVFEMVAEKEAHCEHSRMVGETVYLRRDGKATPDRFVLPKSDLRDVVLMHGHGEIDGWSFEIGMPVSKLVDADSINSAIANFLQQHTAKRDSMKVMP